MALKDHDLRGVPTRTAQQTVDANTHASDPRPVVMAESLAKKHAGGGQGRKRVLAQA